MRFAKMYYVKFSDICLVGSAIEFSIGLSCVHNQRHGNEQLGDDLVTL